MRDPQDVTLHDGWLYPASDAHVHTLRDLGDEQLEAWLPFVLGRRLAVQAGGNVGRLPVALGKFFDVVYTAEPDPVNFACMERNVREHHKVKSTINMIKAALGEKPGYTSLNTEGANCGAYYLQQGDDVQAGTIDSLGLSACDLIALDIEGYELHALKGAVDTIGKYRPTIIVEDKGHGARYGVTQEMLHGWLREHGYRFDHWCGRDSVWQA